MIETGIVSKVKVQDVIVNQLPEFIRDESERTVDFLKQYYISQEYQGGPNDFSTNLDQYLDVTNLTPEIIVDSSVTVGVATIGAGIVTVTSTKGFPNQYGLLKIDDEIITYTGITTNTFTGCKRGFSGITSYHSDLNKEDLVFTSSVSAEHASGSTVENLSSLFLKEFYKKFKKTFLPGLEETDFSSSLDVGTFIKEARSLYQTKGTEESFRILFNVLYGLTPRVLNLEEKLVKPSFANYVRRRVCIAELLSGNPIQLRGQSLLKGLTGQALFRSDLDVNINASISEIEPFERVDSGFSGITTYYKIGLFVGYDEASDVENDFIVVPNTKALETVSAGSSVITVDSTVGFGTTGIVVSGLNTITYTDKTVNQFLNCTGVGVTILPLQNIRSNVTYFGFENGDLDKKVTLRLTGVMADFEQEGNIDVSEGEVISVRSLGDKVENPSTNRTYKETFCNSWIYNTRSSYFITQADGNSFSVGSPIDKSSLKAGDYVEIVSKIDNSILWPTLGNTAASVQAVNDEFTVTLTIGTNTLITQGLISDKSVLVNYKLRKILNKAYSDVTPIEYGNGVIISDIQNVYTESENAYVTSNSLPSFITNNGSTNNFAKYSKKINIAIKTASLDLSDPLSLSGGSEDQTNFTILNFAEDIPFNTGDKVFYSHTETGIVGLETGSYYVAKTGEKSIKLYSSPAAIDGERNLIFNTNAGIGTAKFVLFSQKSGIISPQKLIKKFPLSSNISDGIKDITPVGQTGMLINGVEISNYKSVDKMFFGPVERIQTLNSGENYDVINLPKILISSGIGTTALAQPVISGEFKDVFVDPQSFDLDQVVSIGVTGGNGNGCILEPVVGERFRQVLFDTRPTPVGGINTNGSGNNKNRILCNTDHGFSAGEPVIYDSFGNQGIGTGAGTETLIDRATYYVGLINSQTVKLHRTEEDAIAGTGEIPFNGNNSSGEHALKVGLRNTILDVEVVDGGSGYTNRQLFVKPSGISTESNLVKFENHGFKNGELIEYNGNISGLNVSNSYYVITNNTNSFSLSDAGIGGTDITNYQRGKIVNLQSTGIGIQTFKYPDIKVFAEFTTVGFGTTAIDGKVVLGSEQANLSFTPIVRGSVEQVYLYESGTGYGSTIINNHKKPSVTIKNGKNASLSPIIVNGQINSVRINFGGSEYFSLPDLEIVDPTGSGNGARLKPVISNAGISTVIVINSGIGYSTDTSIKVKSAGDFAFFNAEVRSLTINKHSENDDYQLLEDYDDKLKYSVTGYSTSLLGSSNIIGWAYDGNPIYGPFGSSDPTSTSDLNTRLKSGYTANIGNVEDRPVGFSSGFFVEDHIFDNSGDLDEHNGRYENTKEFPNGTYVYHATLNNSKKPSFPYFIGNSFRSKVIDDNFSIFDQSTFDFNSSNLLRNTFPYKVADDFANNDFIVETNEIKDQRIEVESITSGSITGFNITDGGDNYKVNEFLNFDETNTSGNGLISIISRVGGKTINSLESTVNNTLNSVITWNDKQLNVFTADNHNFNNNDLINISGVSTDLSFLNNQFKIKVENFTSRTISAISPSPSTGFTTEIFVSNIPQSVSAGSSIVIGLETLKILNIYNNLNVLTVKRHSSLYNTSHLEGSDVKFLTNKFTINESVPSFESSNNKKIFFNPSESVGLSTDDGSQQVKSLFFAGKNIVRNVPVKQIYLENHGLSHNQKIKFIVPPEASGGKITISDDNGKSSFDMPDIVFAVPKSNNTIGIKTQLCKLDETPEDEIHFITLTNGNYDNYLFETQLDEVTCKVDQVKTEITTSQPHGLETGDNISLTVQPNLSVGIGTSTAVRISRDSFSGNILINPIGFSSANVNTSTNSFKIENHKLKTGDKVKYESNLLPQGLENKNYFVYRFDDDNIKLCDTLIDSQQTIPNIIGIGSTGGSSQSISLINSKINVIKNNDLVFDLSSSSLSGYQFKLYYDEQFKNEFISVPGISPTFSVGFGTTSSGNAGAKLTLGYGTSLPNILYYNLEKSGTISTTDTEVKNSSKIIFDDSVYTDSYSITKVGLNTFSLFVKSIPEKLSYTSSECDVLKYNTNSKTSVGPIDKIKIISDGSNYKKLPRFIGVGGSSIGEGAVVAPTSEFIGNVEKIRVINEGYEYSSDKTLEPESLIALSVNVINTDTLGIVSVTNGGAGYIDAPNIVVVNSDTGQEIKSGFIEPVMLENSIASVNIVEIPIGLPARPVTLRTVNNTNGIVITDVISNNSGIFTCRIATPNPVFPVDPFTVNDRVFIEGIQKVGTAGSGFNSSDYRYNLLKVSKYENNVNAQGQVTIDVTEFTSNTGTAISNVVTFASLINESDYPTFLVEHNQSKYNIGEKLLIDRNKTGIFVESDLKIVDIDTGKLKIFGRDLLRKENVISGSISGSQSEVSKVTENKGRLKTNFSVLKNLGWRDSIGKLNEDFQVLPNNDYFQNMSYSIQSSIEWRNLRTVVNNLVHTSGMKNFADVGISSAATAGISTDTGDDQITIIMDLVGNKRVDEIKNVDSVRDVEVVGNTSRFLQFDDVRLSDFINCKTNDVLVIDDLSDKFSNLQGNPDDFLSLIEFPLAPDTQLFNNILVVTSSNPSGKLEISELMVMSNGSENILVQKSNLINSGPDLANRPENNIISYSLDTQTLSDASILKFKPEIELNPENDRDYDLKIFTTSFNTNANGIGTISIGPINLNSRIQDCPAGITTNIISVPTDKFDSLYATIQVFDPTSKKMNLVESYVSHKEDDSFLTESYFNGDKINLSLNRLGIITSSVSSGNLILSYESNEFTDTPAAVFSVLKMAGNTVSEFQFGSDPSDPRPLGGLAVGDRFQYNDSDNNKVATLVVQSISLGDNMIFAETDSTLFPPPTPGVAFRVSHMGGSVLKLSNDLKLKSRVIGIGTTGVADGKHRFKTLGQEDGDERTSLYSGTSTSNVGISTLEILDSTKFNAVKSVVEVSIGSSKAIHEVLFMHDEIDAYVQQSGSLSLTKNFNSEYDSSSGLGTFGATLSGSNFTLEFHPDNISGISTVVSLNHCFYTKVDVDNIPQDLNYGVITDNHSIKLFNSLAGFRIKKTQFTPTVNSIPLYGKIFKPDDSVTVEASTGKFSIESHFFRENEELVYKPNSTFVGIGSTPMQFEIKSNGISTIGELPTKVFAKNVTEDSFFISTTRAGTAVTFIGFGEGNAHQFSMKKANEKSLIIIDDVAQYPLIRTNVTHTLNSNLSGQIGLTTNIIHLSGISTISSNDILKIDNEFVEVVNVGFATTGGGPVGSSGTFNTVEVKRAFVGSAASTHSDGAVVNRFKGSYNIEGRDLFFTKPPRGDLTKTKDKNNLDIPTSKFSGRIYLRNNYEDNVIFDDISDQFTGIKSDFTLKVGGANTVGLGTNVEVAPSGILFVNGIFQSPSSQFNPNKNFKILESGSGATGVTTVIFTGITSTDNSQFISNNINTNELPRGGVPISIGNTVNGDGYAPLVGANVKALTNASGQITSIVGTAYSSANLGIEAAKYNNVTGIMTVRTTNEHPFVGSNDFVLLRDFNFTPSISLRSNEYEVVSVGATNVFGVSIGKTTSTHTYNSSGDAFPFYPNLTFGSGYNEIISIGVTVQDLGYEHRFVSANANAISGNRTPTDASYDPVSGVLELTVPNHGLTNSDTVSITTGSIFFSCARDHFQTVHPYPRSTDPVAGISTDVTKIDDNKFSLFVGVNVGNGAKVTATAGIGGTAIFTIVSAGSSYKDPIINVSGPSYANLSVRGISRLGEGLTSNTGTDLRVNAIVTPVTGIGSTMFEVSEYQIVKSGFAFKVGDVVEPVGLITATGVGQLKERSRITIDKIYNDSFALWNFGDFDYIDSIKELQDGTKTSFSLVVNSQLVSVELDENTINSNVDIENVFFVTVNGVIQEPKKAYTIVGGNIINFAEPPIAEDDITILFYKGTTSVDSIVNLAQKLIIEPGDEVQVTKGSGIKAQEKRTVFNLDTSKKLETNPYIGVGISSDVSRSLNLLKQKTDKVINKVVVSKKRSSIEPRITPVAKIISDVTLSDPLELFVDNASIFNYEEDSDPILSFKVVNLPNKPFENPKVTANVSAAGTVTGFSTSNFGFGYTTPPTVRLSAPPPKGSMPGFGIGITATATASIGAGGTITKITVTNPGSNYTVAPQVLISSPINVSDISETLSTPLLSNLTIQNNSGIITGIGTTTYNSSLAIKFNIMGENDIISAGRPIYIYDTHVGSGVKSVNVSGVDSDIVGIGTTFADNVYVVASFQNMGGGIGVITSIIKSDTVVTGLSTNGIVDVGKYSVGRITNLSRGSNPISIGVTGLTVGLSTALGISTFPTIKRVGGLKTFEQTGAIIPEIRPT